MILIYVHNSVYDFDVCPLKYVYGLLVRYMMYGLLDVKRLKE